MLRLERSGVTGRVVGVSPEERDAGAITRRGRGDARGAWFDPNGSLVGDLKRLDPPVRQRVLGAVDHLVSDPRTVSLRTLKGHVESLLGVGDRRVIVEPDVATRAIVVQGVLPGGRGYAR